MFCVGSVIHCEFSDLSTCLLALPGINIVILDFKTFEKASKTMKVTETAIADNTKILLVLHVNAFPVQFISVRMCVCVVTFTKGVPDCIVTWPRILEPVTLPRSTTIGNNSHFSPCSA